MTRRLQVLGSHASRACNSITSARGAPPRPAVGAGLPLQQGEASPTIATARTGKPASVRLASRDARPRVWPASPCPNGDVKA